MTQLVDRRDETRMDASLGIQDAAMAAAGTFCKVRPVDSKACLCARACEDLRAARRALVLSIETAGL